jgi:hypothetical protein
MTLVTLVTVQAAMFAHTFWVQEPRSDFYPTTATHAYLNQHLGDERAVGDGFDLFPGTSGYYRQASPLGHTYFLKGWGELLAQADPGVHRSVTSLLLHATDAVMTSPVLDQLSVRYLATSLEIPPPGPVTTQGASDQTVTLNDGQAVDMPLDSMEVRSIGFVLRAPLNALADPFASFDVSILDSTGATLSTGTRRLYGGLPAGAELSAAVPYTNAPGPLTARLTLHDRGATAAVAGSTNVPMLMVRGSRDDGLRIVQVHDTILYERLRALPLVRWAGTASVVPSAEQPAAVAAGLPPGTVLVSSGPTTSGSTAQISDVQVAGNKTSARVVADGTGYLVVADAAVTGWQATVDGRRVPITTVNNALQGVPVAAGSHSVVLRFVTAGSTAGIAITIATLAVYGLLGGGIVVLRRRRTRNG